MIETEQDNLKTSLSGFYVPSNPRVLDQLGMKINDPDADISDIADIVATDIGLSSAVLKVINSPFYGMSRTVVDIKQAAILLGLETIKTIYKSSNSRTGLASHPSISLERFWDNSSDIANTMEYIGENIKTKIPKEHLRTVGLFHDVGIPAFAAKYPDYINTLVQMDQLTHLTSSDIENSQYNSNHAVMGYYIACSWNIPKDICEIILHHHDIHYLSTQHDEHVQLTFATFKAAENIVEKAKRFKNNYIIKSLS